MKSDEILNLVRNIIKDEGLKERTRKPEKAFPRFYLMYFLWRNTELSLSKIAEEFNIITNKNVGDHSIVVHGRKKHEELHGEAFYKFYTRHIKDRLSGVKPEKQIVKSSLKDKVLNCKSYRGLVELQEELRNG